MESANKAGKLCSKCGINPPSKDNPWCQPCRTEHARKVKELEAEMIGARNWNRGMQALREKMVANMGLCPDYQFKARDVTEWLKTFPAPEYPASGEQPVKE